MEKTMTEISETEIHKSSWGEGPWQHEPDRKEWRDTATGYPCLAVRHGSLGHWCGYVAVPPGHSAHGKSYDDVEVEVHGGLTYANLCSGRVCHIPKPGEPDDVFWLGFDCAHCDDLSPGTRAVLPSLRSEYGQSDTYRTLEYVESECASLARQLAEMQKA
jgi:hypothetical protein